MSINPSSRRLLSLRKKEIPLLMGLITLFFLNFSPVFAPSYFAEAEAGFKIANLSGLVAETPVIQENSFLALGKHYTAIPSIVIERIPMKITGYSSSVWETDDTPYLTAAGTTTRDGIIASNFFPFGTKIRIPELFGNRIFEVEDRMNQRIGDYQLDVWFPSSELARNFGVRHAYIETLR